MTSINIGSVRPGTVDKDQAARAARRIKDYLARHPGEETLELLVEGGPGEALVLPREAVEMFTFVLDSMARGLGVNIMPTHAEFTTQEAAGVLNVSRPYLIGLLEQGLIPYRLVGRHRRIRWDDLMDYRRRDQAARRKVADELSQMSQDIGGD